MGLKDNTRYERRQAERGVVLVVMLVVLGTVVLAWQLRASLSQMLLVQQSLDQASRAAAIGVARWHARLLNAHAMLNRTEMAHQVAMAHLLTLASVWRMRARMGERATRGNPPAFLIGRFFGSQQSRAYQSARLGTDPGDLQALRRAFEIHDQLLSEQLVKARAVLNQDVQKKSQVIASEIVRRNLASGLGSEPPFEVHVGNALGLSEKVRKLESMTRWQHWMDAVMGRQPYLKSRWNMRIALSPFLPTCPILKHLLIRTGSTELRVNGYWSAEDTLSFHAVRPLPKWCYFREYPMGWADVKVMAPPSGSAQLSVPERSAVRAPDRFKSFRKWVSQLGHLAWNLLYPLNNQLAKYYGEGQQMVWPRQSLPVPYHLGPGDHRSSITVSVALKTASLRHRAWRIRLDQAGLLNAQQENWPKYLRATAAAQVMYDHFQAPAHNNRQEAADLLMPFWDAHQIPVSDLH